MASQKQKGLVFSYFRKERGFSSVFPTPKRLRRIIDESLAVDDVEHRRIKQRRQAERSVTSRRVKRTVAAESLQYVGVCCILCG